MYNPVILPNASKSMKPLKHKEKEASFEVSFSVSPAGFYPFAQWSSSTLGAGAGLPFALTNLGRFRLAADSPPD